jgi:hypothetical protein
MWNQTEITECAFTKEDRDRYLAEIDKLSQLTRGSIRHEIDHEKRFNQLYLASEGKTEALRKAEAEAGCAEDKELELNAKAAVRDQTLRLEVFFLCLKRGVTISD